MRGIPDGATCPNCGAPVTTEICPYCGSPTQFASSQADMEYPAIDCKEVCIGFFNVGFLACFAVSFGFFGLVFPLIFLFAGAGSRMGFIFLVCLPFAIIGIVAAVIMFKNIWEYVSVKLHGKKIKGTVYGYMDDDTLYNGRREQIVKILVHTKYGPRFLLYQTGRVDQPYGVNKTVYLSAYKDRFIINKEERGHYTDLWD